MKTIATCISTHVCNGGNTRKHAKEVVEGLVLA